MLGMLCLQSCSWSGKKGLSWGPSFCWDNLSQWLHASKSGRYWKLLLGFADWAWCLHEIVCSFPMERLDKEKDCSDQNWFVWMSFLDAGRGHWQLSQVYPLGAPLITAIQEIKWLLCQQILQILRRNHDPQQDWFTRTLRCFCTYRKNHLCTRMHIQLETCDRGSDQLKPRCLWHAQTNI